MRLTKIICTLGPASASPDMVRQLAESGMDIARINFSHGSQEGHQKTIRMVKDVAEKSGNTIALLLDTKGAEIRTGDVAEPIKIQKGQEVVFSSKPVEGETRPVILINYDKFAHDVKGAECILLENGFLPFDIVSIEKDGTVIGRAKDDASVGSRRHVNLPGADVSLPSMTDKDWSDLALGVEEKMDFVALSFIRSAEEVEEVKEFLKKKGSSMRVITKVETRQAVADIDRIILASDGIMVARGDLGAEMPFQRIPAVQDLIVQKCRHAGKPVIVATHMLESMIEHPMPTRAEVTDIAHAVTTRADSTMLSGETAAGQHPVASISAMRTILEETESLLRPEQNDMHFCPLGESSAMADAAVSMALALKANAIVVFTRSGKTAQAVSSLRSGFPIYAFTETAELQRQLQLTHAVKPLVIGEFGKDPEETLEKAFASIKKSKLVEKGQKVVVITDALTHTGRVHTVNVRIIP